MEYLTAFKSHFIANHQMQISSFPRQQQKQMPSQFRVTLRRYTMTCMCKYLAYSFYYIIMIICCVCPIRTTVSEVHPSAKVLFDTHVIDKVLALIDFMVYLFSIV